jgi:hypothetical protein
MLKLRHAYQHWLGQLAIALLVIATVGCRPKNQTMLVVYVEGDIFLPKLSAGTWNVGEAQRCQIASRGSVPPDKKGDLLLCGGKTQLAWSQTWLRSDIKSQIYEAATAHPVVFHSMGKPAGRGESPRWSCRKTWEGVDCE